MINVLFPIAAISLASTASATSEIITIDAFARGWVAQDGTNNGASSSNNYVAGNCGLNDCEIGEFRNWFEFDLSGLSGQIIHAELVMNGGRIYLDQGPSVQYQLTSYDQSLAFETMGSGQLFGMREFMYEDWNQLRSITLNASAIDALNSGGDVFAVSGRVTEGARFGPTLPRQYAFGYTHTGVRPVQLIVTIPAPSVCGLSITLMGLLVKRRGR